MNHALTLIETFQTTDRALAGIAVLYSVGVIVTSLELLVVRRSLWHDHGLLAWSSLSAAHANRAPAVRRCLDVVGQPFVLDLLLGLRILVAVLVVVCVAFEQNPLVPLAAIALIHVVVHWRLRYVLDGSDKMAGLLAFALLIAAAFPDDRVIRLAAVCFLTAQLVLCYVMAGAVKAATASWWNGSVLQGTLGTTVFGVPVLHRLVVRIPAAARVATCSVIFFELTFPLALVGPPAVTVTYLTAGVLFHAGVAAVMGFNSFLYFFVAAYPAVCYASSALRTELFG